MQVKLFCLHNRCQSAVQVIMEPLVIHAPDRLEMLVMAMERYCAYRYRYKSMVQVFVAGKSKGLFTWR